MTEQTAPAEPKVDVEHIKQQLQHWQAKATDFEKRYGGMDPEEYKALKEEVALLRKEQAVADPKKFDEILGKTKAEIEAELNKRYSTALSEKEKALAETSTELNRLRVVNPAMMKAAEVFNATELPLIQSVIEKDLAWADGKIVIKDDNGKPRVSAKDPRNEMDLAEYMETLAAKYPGCAKSTRKPGSRDAGLTAPANGTQGGTITLERYKQMTAEERKTIPIIERGKLADAMLRGK